MKLTFAHILAAPKQTAFIHAHATCKGYLTSLSLRSKALQKAYFYGKENSFHALRI